MTIKPAWLHKQSAIRYQTSSAGQVLRQWSLHTVCEEARCPNKGECFQNKVATIMILGSTCSRACRFCSVTPGRDLPAPDHDEPERVAQAALNLGLSHVVITSVTRDDLPDGGASHFAQTISAVRQKLPGATVEVLTPDFQGNTDAIETVIAAGPDVFNHNVETVPALYAKVRPQANYPRSLAFLAHIKNMAPDMLTKSGIMVGLGETFEQVVKVMEELAGIGLDMMTIGQYLQPTRRNLEVAGYIEPGLFEEYARAGENLGIRKVFAGPYVRSSYQAGEALLKTRLEPVE
ncbi:MAG: lipoyl synthase [Nitrospinae bacterium]|nr:lipoyl synthase [Nitrospinota bacterium]